MSNKRIKITKDSIELFGDHDPKDVIEIQRQMREESQQIASVPPWEPKSPAPKVKPIGAMNPGPRKFGPAKHAGTKWSKGELNLLYYCCMNNISIKKTAVRLYRKFNIRREDRAVASRWFRLQKEFDSGKFSPDTSAME